MKNYFDLEESMYSNGKLFIRINENAPMGRTEGSTHIFQARLLGLTYPDYLRYCRDVYGATIVGKNQKYPVAFFNKDNPPKALLNELNSRANELMTS